MGSGANSLSQVCAINCGRGCSIPPPASVFIESRAVVRTAAFHARVRGSVPGLGSLKETKMFLPHPRVKVSIVWSLRD